jgi:tetratricopeptide (TPR) repeat protein
MATAPLAALLYDRAYLSGSFREALRLRGPALAALFATTLWLGWLVVAGGGNRSGIIGFGVEVSWPGYLLGQAVALLHYLRLSVWPSPLVFEYGLIEVESLREVLPQVLVASLAVVSAGLAVVLRPKVGFPCFVFLATLAPTSLLPSTTQMIVEHRMYLALSAVLVLIVVGVHNVAAGLPGLRGSRQAMTALATAGAVLGAIVAIVFIAMTRVRNEDYRSELRLWEDTVAKRPRNFLAHHFLAASLEAAGDVQRAGQHYVRALQIEPDFYRSHAAVGRLLAADSRVSEAELHLHRAIELAPERGEARFILGALLAQQGRTNEALVQFAKAESDYADNVVFQYNYAHALQAAGRVAESVRRYEIAVAIDPSFWEARLNLANALSTLDRGAEAIPHFDAVVTFAPSHVAARNNFANALVRLGRREEALVQYRAAVAIDPRRADVHHNLGNVLLELGRRDEAIVSYATALRLDPGAEVTRRVLESLGVQGGP